jgi:hypothetical protein
MSNITTIDCPSCGEKLGVPRDRGTIHVTCPTCRGAWDWVDGRSPIPPGLIVVEDRSRPGSRVARKTDSKSTTRRWIDRLAPIGWLVLFLAGYLAYRQLTSMPPMLLPKKEVIPPRPLPKREVVPPKPLPTRDAGVQALLHPLGDLPPEQPLPRNGDGVFRFGRLEGTTSSGLRIVPRPAQLHIVVKVENWKNGKLVCWFMIREGKSAEIPIPPGTYRVKFAYGKRWYGEKHLFGPDASYSAIVNEIKIPANTVETLNLTPSPTGTFRENKIGPEDF